MSDNIMSSDWRPDAEAAGSVRIAPGSIHGQHRPSLIKRDSDVPGPIFVAMGADGYRLSPARNKKAER